MLCQARHLAARQRVVAKTCRNPWNAGKLEAMKLQDLPRLAPGADIRIRVKDRQLQVELRTTTGAGVGQHCNIDQAAKLALQALQAPP